MKDASSVSGGCVAEHAVSRLSFGFLIATGLILTSYFGMAAWRLSQDSEADITGHISARP
jgi:hypothetical protein